MADALTESARDFFEGLNGRDDMRGLLSGLDQTIRFIVEDGETFHLGASGARFASPRAPAVRRSKTIRMSPTSGQTGRPSGGCGRGRFDTRTP